MAIKTTKVARAMRVDIIYEMILQDKTYRQMVLYGSKEWGVSSRTISKYVVSAKKIIGAESAKHNETVLTELVARYRFYRAKAVDNDDLRLALEISKEESKLLGLYPSEKLQLSGDPDNPIHTKSEHGSLTDRELENRIDGIISGISAATQAKNSNGKN